MEEAGQKRAVSGGLILTLFFCIACLSCSRNPGYDALIAKAKQEGEVFTYGMGDYWGAYKDLMEVFHAKYGITRYDLDMSSAVAVQRLAFDDQQGEHWMDTGIVGITYGPAAKKQGLLSCYASRYLADLPDWAYDQTDPDCPSWYATYYGTLAMGVNTEAVKKIPRSFRDLLSDEYKGKVVMMDPRASATGFATVVAATYAMGGSLSNMKPGLKFFKKLKEKGILLRSLTSQDLDSFVQGRYPIYFNYDYNFVKLKHNTGAPILAIIPADGTIRYPYVNLIPRHPPHPHAMQLLIDFLLSKEGQEIVARNWILPVRTDVQLPAEVKKLLPPVPEDKVFQADWSQGEAALKEAQAFWDKLYGGKE